MNRNTLVLLAAVAATGILAGYYLLVDPDDQPQTPVAGDGPVSASDGNNRQPGYAVSPVTPAGDAVNPFNLLDGDAPVADTPAEELPEGVNPVFHDEPGHQVVWMERGKSIVLKNHPDADNAEFRNTYFHRGAKARPVTCGEVQFTRGGNVTDEFQRFVFVGMQSTHLESDVPNFDILWDIMCVQTLDEYMRDYGNLPAE